MKCSFSEEDSYVRRERSAFFSWFVDFINSTTVRKTSFSICHQRCSQNLKYKQKQGVSIILAINNISIIIVTHLFKTMLGVISLLLIIIVAFLATFRPMISSVIIHQGSGSCIFSHSVSSQYHFNKQKCFSIKECNNTTPLLIMLWW